jgi:hypothetical protein
MNPIIPWAILTAVGWGLVIALYAPRLFRGASETDEVTRRRLLETRRNGSAPWPSADARARCELKAATKQLRRDG